MLLRFAEGTEWELNVIRGRVSGWEGGFEFAETKAEQEGKFLRSVISLRHFQKVPFHYIFFFYICCILFMTATHDS